MGGAAQSSTLKSLACHFAACHYGFRIFTLQFHEYIYIYMLKASMNASTRMPFVPQGPHLAEENATRARGCR